VVVDQHVDAIDAPMSAGGWGAMIAGIVITLLLGIGLMSLLFLSSRRGYDEPPDQAESRGKDGQPAPDRDEP